MKRRLIGIAGAGLLVLSGAAHAQTVTVSGNNNPFLAGQPSGTACCSGDSAPGQSPTLAAMVTAGQVLTFSAIGGFDYSGGTGTASADGSPGLVGMTSDYGTGISGAQNVQYNGLVGVFLGSGAPGGAAPASRNDGIGFTAIAPSLAQIFWIGDGLTGTGTGTIQQFTVPTGATRLFLGSVDGYGWYNNGGTSTVTISGANGAVPEPATWAMMILGIGAIGAMSRRRRAEKAAPINV